MAKYEEIIERTVGLDLNDDEMCDEHYEDDSEYKYFTVTVSGQLRTYARNKENAEDWAATVFKCPGCETNIHEDPFKEDRLKDDFIQMENVTGTFNIEAEEPKKEGA